MLSIIYEIHIYMRYLCYIKCFIGLSSSFLLPFFPLIRDPWKWESVRLREYSLVLAFI